MEIYTGVIYPLVLVVSALLAAAGSAALAAPRLHPVLRWATVLAWVGVGIHLVTVVVVLVSGNDAGLIITLGYLLASVALMPLLGIGRLGTPEAKAADSDPNRPVLAPDQIARVDGAAALIVAIALAVLAWRVYDLLMAGA